MKTNFLLWETIILITQSCCQANRADRRDAPMSYLNRIGKGVTAITKRAPECGRILANIGFVG